MECYEERDKYIPVGWGAGGGINLYRKEQNCDGVGTFLEISRWFPILRRMIKRENLQRGMRKNGKF